MTKIEQVLKELSDLYNLGHEIERAGLSRIGDPVIDVKEALADRDYPALTDCELSQLLADAWATAGERDDLVRVAEHFVHADWKRVDGD